MTNRWEKENKKKLEYNYTKVMGLLYVYIRFVIASYYYFHSHLATNWCNV